VTVANLRPSAAARQLEARSTTGAYERSPEALAEGVPLPPVPPPEALGDCIDDTLCVQVCPTGIDIRNGLQYECIACGACVDACDSVMDRMGFPRGLIRHTTHNGVQGLPTRVLRPRVIVYGLLLLALIVGWGWGVTHRQPLIAEVLRDRNALYRVEGDSIENVYTLKLVNKQEAPQRYRVVLEGGAPVMLTGGVLEIDAGAGAVVTVPLTLQAPAGSVHGRKPVALTVTSIDAPAARARVETAFFAPP
jgi:cytochrome c oxidase accessory protein FixG